MLRLLTLTREANHLSPHAPTVHCPRMPPTQPTPTEKHFFTRWVVASSVGWVFAVIVVLMLTELQDLFTVGNWVYIGVGMGWSIGFGQWRIARKWFGATSRWMWASTIGVTIPFLLADLVGTQWDRGRRYLIPSLAAAGGLLSGLLQRSSLRSLTCRANHRPLTTRAVPYEHGSGQCHAPKWEAVHVFASTGLT
jgi:hypothetical protein